MPRTSADSPSTSSRATDTRRVDRGQGLSVAGSADGHWPGDAEVWRPPVELVPVLAGFARAGLGRSLLGFDGAFDRYVIGLGDPRRCLRRCGSRCDAGRSLRPKTFQEFTRREDDHIGSDQLKQVRVTGYQQISLTASVQGNEVIVLGVPGD